MKVSDVMTRGVIGVPETAGLAEIIDTMLRSRVSAVLVFDKSKTLVGLISEGDLIRRAELGAAETRPRWLEFLMSGGRLAESYTASHGRKASEVMSGDVVTVADDADLSEAVDLMVKRRIKRLPALHGGAVVGVISRSDLLKALAKALPRERAPSSDADIRALIMSELDKLGWAPRASIDVAVESGIVSYSGSITDARFRDALKVIAENTPGVTEVRDHLAWIEPNSGLYVPSPEEDKG
jgi:CBS domain-containing protein